MSNKEIIVTDHSLRAFPMDIEDNVKIVGGLKPNIIGSDVVYARIMRNYAANEANGVVVFGYTEGDTFSVVSGSSIGIAVLGSFSVPYILDSNTNAVFNASNELFIYTSTRILKYTIAGELLGDWEIPGYTKGTNENNALALDKEGFLYCLTTQAALNIHKINTNTGEIVWSTQLQSVSSFNGTICIASNGQIYVSRDVTNKVRIFRVNRITGAQNGIVYNHPTTFLCKNIVWHDNKLWLVSQTTLMRLNEDLTFYDSRVVEGLTTSTVLKGVEIYGSTLYISDFSNFLKFHALDTLALLSTFNLTTGGTATSRLVLPQVDVRGNVYCYSGSGSDQKRINTFDKNNSNVTRQSTASQTTNATIAVKYDKKNGYYQ